MCGGGRAIFILLIKVYPKIWRAVNFYWESLQGAPKLSLNERVKLIILILAVLIKNCLEDDLSSKSSQIKVDGKQIKILNHNFRSCEMREPVSKLDFKSWYDVKRKSETMAKFRAQWKLLVPDGKMEQKSRILSDQRGQWSRKCHILLELQHNLSQHDPRTQHRLLHDDIFRQRNIRMCLQIKREREREIRMESSMCLQTMYPRHLINTQLHPVSVHRQISGSRHGPCRRCNEGTSQRREIEETSRWMMMLDVWDIYGCWEESENERERE